MRIYLIGMPGAGKSTIGRLLASKLNYEFIDLDNYIEQQAMLFVDEIFNLYGEEYFRALESNCLKELTSDNIVVACGGGIVKNPQNKELMAGLCIRLSVPLEILEERIANQNVVRPLLATKTLKDIYLERKDLYEGFTEYCVENIDSNQALAEIMRLVGVNNGKSFNY